VRAVAVSVRAANRRLRRAEHGGDGGGRRRRGRRRRRREFATAPATGRDAPGQSAGHRAVQPGERCSTIITSAQSSLAKGRIAAVLLAPYGDLRRARWAFKQCTAPAADGCKQSFGGTMLVSKC